MKLQFKRFTLFLLLATGSLSSHGQGSLTPPGAPAASMKSLDQIEARIPIASGPFFIFQPGAYYLTTNLTVSSVTAISIATNNVTLDLNGFTLATTSASAAGYGILINKGLRNITILNGFIQGGATNNGAGGYSGSGFGEGISYSGTAPVNVRVTGISVAGCLSDGINLGTDNSTVVEACTVQTVGGNGLVASTIKNSLAADCGSYGIIGDQISDCRGISTSGGAGVLANSSALNCYGSSSSSYGLYALSAQNCQGVSVTGNGLFASTAQNCYGTSTGGIGISAITTQNCYGKSVSNFGIYAPSALNCTGLSSSSYGIYCYGSALNCYGQSTTGTGLHAYAASFCTAYRLGGTAIQAIIANGCFNSAGTNIITYKYNMP